MITSELLTRVEQVCKNTGEEFTLDFVVKSIEAQYSRHYDHSIVRETIWFLIDRGKVDVTRGRNFKWVAD